MSCDTQYVATIATNDQDFYECSPDDYTGDDIVVDFTSPVGGLIRVDMRPGEYANDPDLFVTQGSCDDECVAVSRRLGGNEQVVFEALPNQTYYIQVDDFYN